MIRVACSVRASLRRAARPAGSAALLFAALLAGTGSLVGCDDGREGVVEQSGEPQDLPEDY